MRCAHCNGTGKVHSRVNDLTITCWVCNGSGLGYDPDPSEDMIVTVALAQMVADGYLVKVGDGYELTPVGQAYINQVLGGEVVILDGGAS